MQLLREHLPVCIIDTDGRRLWCGQLGEALQQYPACAGRCAHIAQTLENGDDYLINEQPSRWLRLDRSATGSLRAYLAGLIHVGGFFD